MRFAKYIEQFVTYYDSYLNTGLNDESTLECVCCNNMYTRAMLVDHNYVHFRETKHMIHTLTANAILCNFCVREWYHTCDRFVNTQALKYNTKYEIIQSHEILAQHDVQVLWFDFIVETWRFGQILKITNNSANLELTVKVNAVDEYEAESKIIINIHQMHEDQWYLWCADCQACKIIKPSNIRLDLHNEHMIGWEHSQNKYTNSSQIPVKQHISGCTMIDFDKVRNHEQLWQHLHAL